MARFKVSVGGKTRRTFKTKKGATWFRKRLGKGVVSAVGPKRKGGKKRRKSTRRRKTARRRR